MEQHLVWGELLSARSFGAVFDFDERQAALAQAQEVWHSGP
jgi:hypothetical protein